MIIDSKQLSYALVYHYIDDSQKQGNLYNYNFLNDKSITYKLNTDGATFSLNPIASP